MTFYQHGMSLKALLENPELLNPPKQDAVGKKDKDGDLDVDNSLFLGQSAFLGPQLWDKTYDEADLKLEFMDLDEFLNENDLVGKMADASPSLLEATQPEVQISKPVNQALSLQMSPSSSLPSPPLPTINPNLLTRNFDSPQKSPAPVPRTEQRKSAVITRPTVPSRSPNSPSSPTVMPSENSLDAYSGDEMGDEMAPSVKDRQKRRHRDKNADLCPPEEYGSNTQDLMLASLPGEDFDPCNRRFTADELRPQPLIKKSRKVFVPNELKDDKYWARRRKNNVAAQRSRDARRTKENQIAMRALFLEQQSENLAKELEKAQSENEKLRQRLAKYEPEVLNE